MVSLYVIQAQGSERFDPDTVLDRLLAQFPETITLREDGFKRSIAEAEEVGQFLHSRVVVESLQRLAKRAGPAYLFLIPDSGAPIKGSVRRGLFHLASDQVPAPSMWSRLIDFAEHLGAGKPKIFESPGDTSRLSWFPDSEHYPRITIEMLNQLGKLKLGP